MTDHEDIRKALAAATPGPWETCNRIDVFTANDAAKRGKPGTHVADCDPSSDKDRERAIADAHLIANAPQWLAGLLAECEALRSEVSRLRPSNDCRSAREAARRRMRLDGADAQALEHAITITERERDEARDLAVHRGEQIQRLQAEIAQHLAFRAEVNEALPRPFGVTVAGAIKALRAEVDARPTITREDAAAFVRGAFVKFRDQVHRDSDDGRAVVAIEEALRAHASQPQCPSCHGTRTVMDADHDSRVLTADDCPACSQPKGDGGYDV